MLNKLRRYFLSGLAVLVPIAMAIYLFLLMASFADGLLGKYLQPYFYRHYGFYVHGVGILITVVIILICGFFVANYLGRRIYNAFDQFLLRLPFFKQVYPSLKEVAGFLFSRDEQVKSFKQVVLIEYPRKGIYSVGFLTNETSPKVKELANQQLCNVFVPHSPSPLTGFTTIVPKNEVIYTDIKIEMALKFLISGGVINP